MILPRGITGNGEAEQVVDLKAFRAHCHEAARQLNGQVVALVAAEIPMHHSFARATIAWRDETLELLLNLHYPLLAFTHPETPGSFNFQFCDSPPLAEIFATFATYRLLSAAELNQYPKPEFLTDLSQRELEDVRYWRPEKIGYVLYNFWD